MHLMESRGMVDRPCRMRVEVAQGMEEMAPRMAEGLDMNGGNRGSVDAT